MPDIDPRSAASTRVSPSQREPAPSPARARRAAVAAFDDRTLMLAMRDGDTHAWAEFAARFRTPLMAYVRRVHLTPGLTEADVVDALVDELLADEGARLTAPNAPVVPVLAPYLLRAARHRLINLKRSAARRTRRHATAAADSLGDGDAEHVVGPLCSEYARRVSAGPVMVREGAVDVVPDGETDGVAQRLAAALRAATTTDEQQLLGWVSQRVPYRTIAAWLNIGYDATAKRIARLSRRLRAAVVRYAESAPLEERADLERFLRRAGALPPLVVTAPAKYHAVGTTVIPVEDHD